MCTRTDFRFKRRDQNFRFLLFLLSPYSWRAGNEAGTYRRKKTREREKTCIVIATGFPCSCWRTLGNQCWAVSLNMIWAENLQTDSPPKFFYSPLSLIRLPFKWVQYGGSKYPISLSSSTYTAHCGLNCVQPYSVSAVCTAVKRVELEEEEEEDEGGTRLESS